MFKDQVKQTEALLQEWYPKNLNFGPHVADGEASGNFDIRANGVLLHSKKQYNHAALQKSKLRQDSIKQALKDIIAGKTPTIESEEEKKAREEEAAEAQKDKLAAEAKAKEQAERAAAKAQDEKAKAEAAVQAKKAEEEAKKKKAAAKKKAQEAKKVAAKKAEEAKMAEEKRKSEEEAAKKTAEEEAAKAAKEKEVKAAAEAARKEAEEAAKVKDASPNVNEEASSHVQQARKDVTMPIGVQQQPAKVTHSAGLFAFLTCCRPADEKDFDGDDVPKQVLGA